MTIKNRLVQFLKYKGITQKKFADMIDLSAGYVNSIRTRMMPNTLNKISDIFPELNVNWVLTGEGDMLNAVSGESKMQIPELSGIMRRGPGKQITEPVTPKKRGRKPKIQKENAPDALIHAAPEAEDTTQRTKLSKEGSLFAEIETLKSHIRELESETNRLKGKNEANEYTIKILMKQFGINYKQSGQE